MPGEVPSLNFSDGSIGQIAELLVGNLTQVGSDLLPLLPKFHDKLLFITEFANVNQLTNAYVKGNEYIKFYQILEQGKGGIKIWLIPCYDILSYLQKYIFGCIYKLEIVHIHM